jgi:hypothetical protein
MRAIAVLLLLSALAHQGIAYTSNDIENSDQGMSWRDSTLPLAYSALLPHSICAGSALPAHITTLRLVEVFLFDTDDELDTPAAHLARSMENLQVGQHHAAALRRKCSTELWQHC